MCGSQIVASGLLSLKSVVLDVENGNIQDMASLCECLRASMLLPGLTGPVVHLPLWGPPPSGGPVLRGGNVMGGGPQAMLQPLVAASALPRLSVPAPKALVSEPLADALLFEPIPYRSPITQGASHVLVLRTRPDGAPVGRLKGLQAAVSYRRKEEQTQIYIFLLLDMNASNAYRPTDLFSISPPICLCIRVSRTPLSLFCLLDEGDSLHRDKQRHLSIYLSIYLYIYICILCIYIMYIYMYIYVYVYVMEDGELMGWSL